MQHFKKYLQRHISISDEQFDLLGSELTAKSYVKGTHLLGEGGTSQVSYFVSRGLLRVFTLDAKGKEHVIQFAPEDWWIGDRGSMYFNRPAAFNIDVLEDSEVVLLSRSFMDHAQAVCPGFAAYHVQLLHNAAWHMQNRINQLLAATAEERYLHFIHLYPDLTLRIPQWMIASYLGITPESLSRVRRELAHKHTKPKVF